MLNVLTQLDPIHANVKKDLRVMVWIAKVRKQPLNNDKNSPNNIKIIMR